MQHSHNSATNPMQALWAFFPAAWLPGAQGQPTGQMAAPAQGVEMAIQSFEPLLRAVSQSNIELLRLWTRRSQAVAELATKAAQIREPQDLMGLQTHYWQTATQHYTDAARQVVSSWGSVMPMAGALANSMGQQATTAVQKAADTARDFMPVPAEAKESAVQAATPAQRPAGGDRDRRSAA